MNAVRLLLLIFSVSLLTGCPPPEEKVCCKNVQGGQPSYKPISKCSASDQLPPEDCH